MDAYIIFCISIISANTEDFILDISSALSGILKFQNIIQYLSLYSIISHV